MEKKSRDSVLAQEVFLSYLDSKRRLALANISKCSNNENRLKNDEMIVRYIEELLKHFDEDSYRILYNEYILRKPGKWYLEYYTKSTFYHLKNKATSKLIRCLHE
ncbi:hypothetical protein EII25_04630 [Erysipelotrichaceae bacterium OH741_COT-311]|nr:hypothetical protein EII25_04630 [Erysipelotrichaceae bacterium OH741_COT-311]